MIVDITKQYQPALRSLVVVVVHPGRFGLEIPTVGPGVVVASLNYCGRVTCRKAALTAPNGVQKAPKKTVVEKPGVGSEKVARLGGFELSQKLRKSWDGCWPQPIGGYLNHGRLQAVLKAAGQHRVWLSPPLALTGSRSFWRSLVLADRRALDSPVVDPAPTYQKLQTKGTRVPFPVAGSLRRARHRPGRASGTGKGRNRAGWVPATIIDNDISSLLSPPSPPRSHLFVSRPLINHS